MALGPDTLALALAAGSVVTPSKDSQGPGSSLMPAGVPQGALVIIPQGHDSRIVGCEHSSKISPGQK